MIFVTNNADEAKALVKSFCRQFQSGFRPVIVDFGDVAKDFLKPLPESTWLASNGTTTFALSASNNNVALLLVSKNHYQNIDIDASAEFDILATFSRLQWGKFDEVGYP
jgi:hypothetical protein